jgi:hypothetical protein
MQNLKKELKISERAKRYEARMNKGLIDSKKEKAEKSAAKTLEEEIEKCDSIDSARTISDSG